MNPIDVMAVAYMNRTDEERKLLRLRHELTQLRIHTELRDNNTALLVHRPGGRGLPLWVFVGYGGAYFSWQYAEKRHPVNDAEGAAKVLAEYVSR
ncbi:hypothetical protein ACFY05_42930 [Microtetraspora fusca]|uniref:Uncharacterized protein n=1 Tax=Microtetraspora fusca TaxID=1997 RepID=A0ABW6VK15_MICFU